MRKDNRKVPDILQKQTELAGKQRSQRILKSTAFGLAFVVGLTSLYYCLLPALAENAGGTEATYMYFDNGLSKYNVKIEYAIHNEEGYTGRGGDMALLSDVIAADPDDPRIPDLTNVNPDNVYVTSEPVSVGEMIQFKAKASGTVYDTVTNYRVNSASREWGYDYQNFQWISDTYKIENVVNNCYYAPPQLMQYRYSGEANTVDISSGTASELKKPEQFIYAHGEKLNHGTGEVITAKPEGSGSSTVLIQPDTAVNRTFANAIYEMEGEFGDVNAINTLGDNSQSGIVQTVNDDGSVTTTTGNVTYEGSYDINGDGVNGLQRATKVYHAKAEFYDYYSDWELAGNPLEEHIMTYGHTDADAKDATLLANSFAFSEEDEDGKIKVTRSEKLKTTFDNDQHGFFAGLANNSTGGVGLTTDENHTSTGGSSLYVYRTRSGDRTGIDLTNSVSSSNLYLVNAWLNARENTILYVRLEYTDSAGATVSTDLLGAVNVTAGTWSEFTTPIFAIPDGCSNVKLYIGGADGGRVYFYVDDFVLTEINTDTDGEDETDTVVENDIPFRVASEPIILKSGAAGGEDYAYYIDSASAFQYHIDPNVHTYSGSTYSTKEIYKFIANVSPDADDTIEMKIAYRDASGNEVYTVTLATAEVKAGEWAELSVQDVMHPMGYTDAIIYVDSVNGSSFNVDGFSHIREYFNFSEGNTYYDGTSKNTNGSFSEGTNRISYSYQGMLWNSAISDYYEELVALKGEMASAVTPLYFGSNSWFTGNNRYFTEDRKGQALYSQTDVDALLTGTYTDPLKFYTLTNSAGEQIKADNWKSNAPVYGAAYVIPYNRQYLKDLFGFNRDANNPAAYVAEMNYPFGNSNSRGVPGLVDLDSGSIVLAGTDTGENFIDFNGNNLYDVAEVYTDENGNGKYDTAESYTDSNENGSYDYAEVYVDSNANGVYDADEPFEDADGDGVYDYAEPYTDADGDGVYDADEPFEDADGNGVYDVAESFDDVNDNGVRDGSDVMPYFNEAFIEGANDDYAAYGKVYNNVAFDFAYNDESGYFEYDSTRAQYATRVSYNQATGFYMDYYNYDEINYQNITDAEGVKKADADWEDVNGSSQTVYQFYPFNSPLTNDRFATENLMFGMKLNIPFNMFKAEEKRNESMFKFSGDDDVWVYVDNQQVLDIGGTHTAVGGVIDLKHGYALTGSSFSADTGEADSSFAVTNSGTAVGVTDIEKAAFAIASSAKITEDGRTFEVGFDPDRQNTPINITAAEFFDDSYVPADASKPMQYEYVIDEANEVIKIKFSNVKKADGSLLKDSNENKVTEGYAVLRLTKFTLRDDGVSGDIQEHDLDIYYLERGLNSSNFKLAFNFVENTERTVEKKWADGAENHTDPDESVTVELYRTEPQVIENSTFTFPSGNTMIRAVSNKADGTTAENSAFAKTSDAVMVQYKVANSVDDKVDGAVVENGAVTLSFNGMLLNKDLFTQLSNDTRVNLKITINGTAVKADDFLASVGNLTYENGELEDGTSATATEAADMVYLKLPYNSENPLEQNRSIIQISFNPSEKFSATANDTGSAWKLNGGSNGWLLEASAYNADTGARVTVAEQKIPTHTSNKTLLVPEIVTDGVITQAARELNADDMRFVIYRTLTTSNVDNNQRPDGDKVYTTYDDYDYRYNVNVIHKNDIITYTDAVHTSSTRGVVVERGEDVLVQGAFGSGKNLVIQVGSDQTLLDSSASVQVATEDDVILDVYAKGDNNRYYSMEPDDTAVKRTDAESLIAYSDAYLVGKPVVLKHTDDIDNWKYVWDNIIEGITVEGELKEYRYFIRETKVTDAEGRDVTSQYTSQYEDADGNIIQPSYISVAGYADPLKLYSIDNAAKFAAVRNIPSTDLQLKKVWSAAAVKQEETGVQIDIYSTTGTPDLFDDRNNNGVCDYAEVDPVTNEVITPTELLVDHNQNSVYDGVAGEHVTTVTLMPDTQATNEATDPNDLIWKKTVQNLPLYKQVGSEWVKLNYYAVEHSMTYTATEDGTEVQKKYLVSYTPDQGAAIFNLDEGETALVYPVRMGDDENPTATLTVTNRPDNAGAFELKLYKYEAPYDPSSEENIPIKNAEFSLQRRQVEKAVDPVTNEVTYTALTDWSDVDSSMKILTDENGVYTIPAIDNTNGDELVIYQYKLQEVAVPLIYVKDSTEIYFTVETLEDKVIDYVVAAGPTGDLLYSQSWDPDTLSLELILQNEPIEIVIPNTGGGGDTLFRIGGTVSMILFLIGMELRRRKYSA